MKRKRGVSLTTFLRIFAIFVLLSFLIIAVFKIPDFICINKVDCNSQYGVCSDGLDSEIGVKTGRTLRQAKKEVSRLLSGNLLVQNFSFQYKFPDRLIVNIIEVNPKFALFGSDGKYALIAADGKVVRAATETNLPFAVFPGGTPEAGGKVDAKTLFGLNLLLAVYNSYQIKTGSLTESSLSIDLPGGLSVIFPLEGDPDLLMGSLIVLTERLNASAKESKIDTVGNIKVIDLRFKNPVLK